MHLAKAQEVHWSSKPRTREGLPRERGAELVQVRERGKARLALSNLRGWSDSANSTFLLSSEWGSCWLIGHSRQERMAKLVRA